VLNIFDFIMTENNYIPEEVEVEEEEEKEKGKEEESAAKETTGQEAASSVDHPQKSSVNVETKSCKGGVQMSKNAKETPAAGAEGVPLGTKIAIGVGVVGGLVALGATVPIMMGFGAGGIMAGSMAAAWQSAIGNVVAGSTFATLQSMGATGTFVAVQTAGFGTVAAGAAGALASQLVGDTKQTTEAITKSKKKELPTDDGTVMMEHYEAEEQRRGKTNKTTPDGIPFGKIVFPDPARLPH